LRVLSRPAVLRLSCSSHRETCLAIDRAWSNAGYSLTDRIDDFRIRSITGREGGDE